MSLATPNMEASAKINAVATQIIFIPIVLVIVYSPLQDIISSYPAPLCCQALAFKQKIGETFIKASPIF